MKLLLITSIIEFEKEVKQILKHAQVKAYSYKEVTGYLNVSTDAMASNWFGTEMNENASILFYAFVPKEHVDNVLTMVTDFNKKQETASSIHVAEISIEKSTLTQNEK